MTFITITSEELAALAFLGGVGSLSLSASIYFFKIADQGEAVSVGLAFCAAITIVVYVFIGGLVGRIRRRSGLSAWKLFS